MKKRKRILFILLIMFYAISAIPFSCKKKKNEVPEYDRTTMLSNIGNNIILPSYQDLQYKANDLYTAAATFTNTPDAANLASLQNAWKAATTSWKQCEVYTFAYAGDNNITSKIDAWPTNTTVIESEISGTNAISEAYISSIGTTRKGFPAIEYLIFSNSGNSVILDNFTTQPNYTRRREYLLALTADIRTKTTATYNNWSASGGNYIATFITSSSTDAGSSVSLLLNAMIQHLEVVKNTKLGVPLGKSTGGVLHPELVEAGLSAMSLSYMKANLQTLENLYLGKANGTNGQGFDDYLDYVKAEYEGQSLSGMITQQFIACYNALNAITPPLDNSITTENAACETAYLELKKLVVLLKVDMSSQLGILITFSDNDGD